MLYYHDGFSSRREIKRSKWEIKKAEPCCWLTEQPIEILVALLMTVIETEETPQMKTFWTLVLNFREFAELTLLVKDSGPEEPCLHECGLLRVHINNFFLCPRQEAHKRPIKFFQKAKKKCNDKLWPWLHLDVQAHPILEVPSTWVSCALEPDRVNCHPLDPYPGFQPKASRAPAYDEVTVDYFELDNSDAMEMTKLHNETEIILSRQAEDLDCWMLRRKDGILYRLLVKNCVNFHLVLPCRFFYLIKFLSINVIGTDLNLRSKPPLVHLSFMPRQRLHIVYSSYLVPDVVEYPDMTTFPYHDFEKGNTNESAFTLNNTNWSYKNPYGRSPPHESQALEELEDQATLNFLKRRQRLRHLPDGYITSLAYRYFSIVKLYGAPDSAFLGMDPALKWAAHCFYWWRLSPRTAGAMEWPNVRIDAPKLKELYLISVVRNCHTTPNFISPLLSKLVLISLDDSDAPWNLRQLLAGTGSLWQLKDVYLEKRTYKSCSEGADTWIPINSYDLKPISFAVGRLHIRGYVPLFLLHHSLNSGVKARFSMLVQMMLDISLIGHCHELEPSTGCGSGKAVTLIFSDFTYPCLKELTLMCSKEAHDSKALASLKIDITVPRKCRDVIISTLIEAESISLNGRLVITPEIFVGKRSAYEPLVPSRKCVRWKYKWLRRRFICCGEVLINNDSLSDIREY